MASPNRESRPPSSLAEKDVERAPATASVGSAQSGRVSGWKKILGSPQGVEEREVKRAMKSRHLTMIALGGTLGTGIFLSVGGSIALAGPASTLLSYALVGLFVYAVVLCLGEMSAMYPVSGAFAEFGTRFVSPALGFTLGWNYWLQWALTIPSELTAAAIILQYWTTALQPWHWAIIIIAPIFAMQLIHVRAYGESEYWFAMIKVLMIVIFIIAGLIYDWGGVAGHPGPGRANFENGQAFIGGFKAFAQTFSFAFYAYGGAEIVALAAGEADKPHLAVPKAVKATLGRIAMFYLMTVLVIGLCINSSDPTLISSSSSDGAASPITIVLQRAGFGAATHVVNAVLLTAVLSATNSCFYASSRMMMSMARAGHAPAIFGWVNSRGVPVPALLITLALCFVSFLTTIWGAGVVFTWLINLTGISALFVWLSVGIINIRFRQAMVVQGRSLDDLPYLQPLYPALPIMLTVLGIAMFVALGYASVVQTPFDGKNIAATYLSFGLYVAFYVGYAVYERFVLHSPRHFVPLNEMDLDTGAVWGPGEGMRVKELEREEKAEAWAAMKAKRGPLAWVMRVGQSIV